MSASLPSPATRKEAAPRRNALSPFSFGAAIVCTVGLGNPISQGDSLRRASGLLEKSPFRSPYLQLYMQALWLRPYERSILPLSPTTAPSTPDSNFLLSPTHLAVTTFDQPIIHDSPDQVDELKVSQGTNHPSPYEGFLGSILVEDGSKAGYRLFSPSPSPLSQSLLTDASADNSFATAPAEAISRSPPYDSPAFANSLPRLWNGKTSFFINKLLAKQGFNRVFGATTDLGEDVAIKVLHKAAIRHYQGARSAKNEVDVLRLITREADCAFLTALLSSWQDEENVYLVMRLYPLNLQQRLSQPLPLSIEEISLYTAQLVLALEALHDLHIIHRDLKPANILISPSGNLCLADFGVAKSFKRFKSDARTELMLKYQYASEGVGTVHYCAPEIKAQGKHNFSVDIWGLGLLLLEMLLGTSGSYVKKMNHERRPTCQWQQLHCDIDEIIHDRITRDLLHQLLDVNPKRRPTLKQIKEHPFFFSIDWLRVGAREYIPAHRARCTFPLDLHPTLSFSTFYRIRGCDPDGRTPRADDGTYGDYAGIDFNFDCPASMRFDAMHDGPAARPAQK